MPEGRESAVAADVLLARLLWSVYTRCVTDSQQVATREVVTSRNGPLPEMWSKLAAYRANYGLGDPRTWVGLSHLSRWDRLKRLMDQPTSREMYELMTGLSEVDLRQLCTLADVNVERATYALRTTFVLNFSSPIATVVALGQLFPAEFKLFLERLDERGLFEGLLIFFVAGILLTTAYAWIRTRDALEIRDIIRIVASRVRAAGTTDEDEGH